MMNYVEMLKSKKDNLERNIRASYDRKFAGDAIAYANAIIEREAWKGELKAIEIILDDRCLVASIKTQEACTSFGMMERCPA